MPKIEDKLPKTEDKAPTIGDKLIQTALVSKYLYNKGD